MIVKHSHYYRYGIRLDKRIKKHYKKSAYKRWLADRKGWLVIHKYI